MDANDILLILQALDLLIKLVPNVVTLVDEIKAAIADDPKTAATLKQITDGTIAVSDETLDKLKALLPGAIA